MYMPFGKHQGRHIADLPDHYLIWLVSNCKLYGNLRTAIIWELDKRGYNPADFDEQHEEPPRYSLPPQPGNINVPEADRALFGELVSAGYRTLAMRHHPDHGGDAETMRRLNRLMEVLRAQLQPKN